jgi:hypothetical protein
VPIPLRPGETEPAIKLQALAQAVYDRGGFDLAVNYRREPEPPFPPAEAAWADRLLRERGVR